jgi:hypothetical protein
MTKMRPGDRLPEDKSQWTNEELERELMFANACKDDGKHQQVWCEAVHAEAFRRAGAGSAPWPPIDPVVVHITPTLEFLRDIVITALEGGIGYWACAEKYRWSEDGTLEKMLPFPEVVLVPDEDPDDFPKTAITPEIIRKGLQLALTPGIMHPGSNTVRSTMSALMEMDAGAIDTDAADNIVQLGMFGKLVFG